MRHVAVVLLVVLLLPACAGNARPTLIKFDAAALTAVQEIARIEREQSALGNLTPADALLVRRALQPVIMLGQAATEALIAWEPGEPIPVAMLKLAAAFGDLLETATLAISNPTAKLAILVAIATAQQAWQTAIVIMEGGKPPVLAGGVA